MISTTASLNLNTDSAEDIAILIPTLNPDDKLITTIYQLIKYGFKNIIIVNDGSKNECKHIFSKIQTIKECTVLQHAVNLGKGRALKTGFNYFSNHYNEYIGLITVDADGQHKAEDVIKVAKALKTNQDSLILGTRNFKQEDIPFRSRFGNLLTIKIFSFLSGIKISDTQTGLRGIPYNVLSSMLNITGEKYEYEMNMLLECSQKRIKIKEVPIETIYIDENESSHFNPLIDSIKIYAVFLKFLTVSFLSFFVDIFLFNLFTKMFSVLVPTHFIVLSTVAARIFSSIFNYSVNRKAVFQHKGSNKKTITKYYLLCVTQMLASAYGVSLLYNQIGQGEVLIKFFVDLVLFLISFKIQKEWVFKHE